MHWRQEQIPFGEYYAITIGELMQTPTGRGYLCRLNRRRLTSKPLKKAVRRAVLEIYVEHARERAGSDA